MRRVTWPITEGKMVHIFEIPDLTLPIHIVTFMINIQNHSLYAS